MADTLLGASSDIARHLDLTTLERLPASFVTEHLGQRHADMLWRIQTTDGKWLYWLVLLEFQSTIDRRMALRMMDYTVRILRGLDRDELGSHGEYPVVLPVVVYNGEQRWNAATDVRDLFAPVPEELVGYLPRHRYLLIEVQTLDPSILSADNVLAMIARFERAQSLGDVKALLVPLADLLDRAAEPKLVESFKAWIGLVVAQRFTPERDYVELQIGTEEDRKMTTLIDRARKWGEERDQQCVEKGIERGERDLAFRLVADRFGGDTALELARLLDKMPAAPHIPAIVRLIFASENAEEFLERVRDA